MKKFILIALIALSSSDLFSQIEKGKFLVTVSGNYMKSATENGVTTNQNITQGKYLTIETSCGYFITERIILGVGLDYYWSKESRLNEMRINRYIQMQRMDIKSKAFLPNIYLGYFYPIINKLYFSTNFKISYGKINSDNITMLLGAADYHSDSIRIIDEYSSYASVIRSSSDVDYFSFNITPELTYFIFSKLSLNLGFGGIEYSIIDWKADNSGWIINFNPTYWKLGFKLLL